MFAATGRGPFGEGRPEAILYRIVHEEPDLSGLDARIVPVVRAALARDPESRPSTSDLTHALSAALAGGDPDPAAIGTAVMTRTELLVAEKRPDITTPVVPVAPPRKRWIIAVAAIVGLAAIGGAAIFTGGFGTHSPTVLGTTTTTRATAIAPTTTAPTTSTTISTAHQTVTASVPVVACPTTWATPGHSPLRLPSSVTLSLPSNLLGQVTDYMDQQKIMQLIGPKGWQCAAFYGADGGGGAEVYPPNEQAPSGYAFSPQSAEAIESHETSACQSCRLDQACPLFPSAAVALVNQYPGESCPYAKPAEEQSKALSTTVVEFEDPPYVVGDGNPSGGPYPANGVMIYGPGSVMDGSWIETCTLPAGEHSLCNVSLNEFVSLYQNN
jgi:hypothetical protein